jgi:hypothetical protein
VCVCSHGISTAQQILYLPNDEEPAKDSAILEDSGVENGSMIYLLIEEEMCPPQITSSFTQSFGPETASGAPKVTVEFGGIWSGKKNVQLARELSCLSEHVEFKIVAIGPSIEYEWCEAPVDDGASKAGCARPNWKPVRDSDNNRCVFSTFHLLRWVVFHLLRWVGSVDRLLNSRVFLLNSRVFLLNSRAFHRHTDSTLTFPALTVEQTLKCYWYAKFHCLFAARNTFTHTWCMEMHTLIHGNTYSHTAALVCVCAVYTATHMLCVFFM